jgi:hypothetical protein
MFPQIFWAVFVSEICITNNVDNNRGLFGGALYPIRCTESLLNIMYVIGTQEPNDFKHLAIKPPPYM